MRIVDSLIDNFEDLMDEIAYDWGFGSGGEKPRIHKGMNYYSINKTNIFKEKGKYYLTYKLDSHEITEIVYKKFEEFYRLLYEV